MNSPRNVLFISYDGLTDQLGQSQIIPYLAGLSKKGYRIAILSCEKRDRHIKFASTIKAILESSDLSWIPVNYKKKPPVISTLYNMIVMYRTAKKFMRHEKIRILHCRSTLSAIVGRLLQNKNQPRLLFDMRGFWADERVEGGLWPQSNFLYRTIYKYIKKQEALLMLHADHIISLTEAGKKIIEQKFSKQNKMVPVTVIPCSADLHLFNPENYNIESLQQKKKALAINENTLVLSYLGSIGTWYMLDEMMEFFKVLSKEIPDSCFLFITKDRPQIILSSAARIGLNANTIKIVQAERNEVPGLLAISNITIFFIRPGYSKKASCPTKFGESLVMGIPVICNSGVGDCDRIMENPNAGWVIETFDINSYADIIAAIKKNINSKNAVTREIGINNFSLDNAVEKYGMVYHQLLN